MDWRGKKVLVTGCSGVIGRHLVKELLAKGALVRGIDMNNCFSLTEDKNFDFIQKDLLHLNPINVLYFEPEIVFHLAAAFERSQENVEFWQNNYMNNVSVSHQVIDLLRFTPSVKRFIFASSYLIYDSALYCGTNAKAAPQYLKEDMPREPRNLTGAAKYYAEKEIEFFYKNHTHKVPYVNARIYRVYGEGSKDIISRWVRSALKGEALTLFGKDNSFDYIYAQDVAKGLMKLSESDYVGVVNLGTGQSTPVSTVIKILKESFKSLKVKEVKHEELTEKSGASMALFKRITGWLPEVDVQQGIDHIIRYEKNT